MTKTSLRISSHVIPLLLGLLTLISVGVVIIALRVGYDIVIANILYIPLIVACFYYSWRGFAFSSVLVSVFLIIVLAVKPGFIVLESALIQSVFFLIISGVIAVFSTIRTKSSEKLAEAENQFDSLFEAISEGFAYCKMIRDETEKTVDFEYLKVNSSFEKITGLSRIEGKRGSEIARDLIKQDPDLFKTYKRVADTGNCESCEIKLASGSVHLSVSVYCPQKGYFLAVVTNITGRRKTEEALKESKTRISQIVSHLPVPLLYVGSSGDIEIMNSRFVQTFGYSHLEIPTLFAFWDRIFPDEMYRQWVKHTWQRAVEKSRTTGKDIEPAEYSVTCQNGDRRVVQISGITIEEHVLVTFVDFTDKRHAEEETNQKLRFLTGLTRHDIFNQLAAVQRFHSLAIEEQDLATKNRYITYATQAADRIESIIGFTRDYETFGTVSSGWQKVAGIIDSAQMEVPLGGVLVENKIPPDLEIYADPLIRKVFTSLMENAVRHGGTVRKIRFSAKESATTLKIICEDDGAGVVKEEKECIFDHGYGKHTGIGLFLSREVLSITGLSITENGRPGKGARFEIVVPEGRFRQPDS